MFNTEDEILRRLQEKNLEMAVMFYHWCQRNHLTCYLCGGGCIGAIRHGGFIPWDDDLDFFMPRKDYEKFLKIWDTQEESKIYKLEYPKEGFCNAHTFANIRDSRTTQVKKEQVDMDLCHGVALDILPIEGYAPGNLARKWQVIEGKIFQLFCTQVIPTKERHGAFMHYLGTILLALAQNARRVLNREQLLALTHNESTEVFDRTIDVLIMRLRRKIELNPHQPTLIKTLRGLGYVFSADVTHSEKAA